jgi:hypothetical protein
MNKNQSRLTSFGVDPHAELHKKLFSSSMDWALFLGVMRPDLPTHLPLIPRLKSSEFYRHSSWRTDF